MQLGALAERILLAPSLELKLQCPATVLDDQPHVSRSIPQLPARPPELAFGRIKDSSPLPSIHQLENESVRGRLLHFFANHELLATELMALVLLKFPEAPPAFRAGVFRTLQEEQEHTRLYLRRLQQLGVTFGQYPVSGYFWNSIASMESPMDYVSRLSLTFEQANLDFSAFFASRFKAIGDLESSRLLARIHRDEIGHVGYGLEWFRRWKDPGQDDWDAFQGALKFPLSPSRAKGAPFHPGSRRKAGLDARFIAELFVYSQSKGRTPAVYLFNPLAESLMSRGVSGKPSRALSALQEDLANLPQFLSRADDVVLVPHRPRTEFLTDLKLAGFDLPQFEQLAKHALAEHSPLRTRKIGALRPWAWSPDSLQVLTPLMPNLPPDTPRVQAQWWESQIKPLYSKAWSAALLGQFLAQRTDRDWLCLDEHVGLCAAHATEAFDLVESLRQRGHHRLVAKALFGLAGQSALRLWEPHLLDAQKTWIRRQLDRDGALIIEPWLDRVLDFSVQWEMSPRGLRQVGWVKMIADHRGQYLASVCEPKFTMGLDRSLAEWLRGQGRSRTEKLYQDLAHFLEPKLHEAGFQGALGIDAMVYRDIQGHLRLKPIVEINARYTMGRVALELMRYAATGTCGRLELLGQPALTKTKHATFVSLAEALKHLHPLRKVGHPKPRIAHGVVCLNDPAHAKHVLAIWTVGSSAEVRESVVQGTM